MSFSAGTKSDVAESADFLQLAHVPWWKHISSSPLSTIVSIFLGLLIDGRLQILLKLGKDAREQVGTHIRP